VQHQERNLLEGEQCRRGSKWDSNRGFVSDLPSSQEKMQAVSQFDVLESRNSSRFARQANTCGSFRTNQSHTHPFFPFSMVLQPSRAKPCPTCRIAGQNKGKCLYSRLRAGNPKMPPCHTGYQYPQRPNVPPLQQAVTGAQAQCGAFRGWGFT
jgi:hypothetical protein